MKKVIIILTILVLFLNINNHTCSKELNYNFKTLNSPTIYVDDDNINGPWNGTIQYPYRCINDGIKNSTDGDTIYVLNGIYNETISINKTIKLIGEQKNSTIIDGGYAEVILHLIKDNIVINNITVRNSNGYLSNSGIKIVSNKNSIINCSIYRTKTGIHLKNTYSNLIDNCTLHTNGNGIFLDSSEKNTISGCLICHNSIGIDIENSKNNLITHNYMNSNGYACLLNGSSNIKINHCNISDNQANQGGIFIRKCTNISIYNSIISHNGIGIHLYSSEKISVKFCELFLNTHFAMIMRTPSKNVVIKNCNIRNNLRYGFYLEKWNSLTIKKCNIYENMLYGICSKLSYIYARNNWWGSPFGPSHTTLRKTSRISFGINRIKILPWYLKPLKNVGANWKNNEQYLKKEMVIFERTIEFLDKDSDLDGTPDWWEEKWGYNPNLWDDHKNLDPDEDALSNIEECYTDQYGSSPYYKDIFLEIDWMESPGSDKSNKPSPKLIKELVEIFENQSINLHVDIGELGGGEEIPYCDLQFSFSRLRDLYWNYFLHNDLNNPRKGIFRYGVICKYCPDLNFPFIGWDHLDTFAISAEWTKEVNPYISLDRLIVGGIAHHLGHTLGLLADAYNGIDNVDTAKLFSIQWWKYRNYKSCMNYNWKYKIFSFSDGTHGRGDFDDWSSMDLSFFKNSHFE